MKKILLTVLITAMCVQWSKALDTYLTFENDALISAGDNDYTHGTCFEVVDFDWHYKVGQNMYAPSDLTRKDHIVGDRPYAGLIYGGVGKEIVFDEESMFTHYFEVDFGMIGPSARCKETQKFIHKILGCRDPKGWDNQLHDEPVVNVQWWTKYNWYICDYVALVPRAGAFAGTVQDAAEVGCDLKIGWNLKNDVGNQILFSSTRRGGWKEKLSVWGFAGFDERYYLYNHVLEGSMFSHKDDDLKVDIEPFIPEWRCGAALRYDRFYVYYYAVFRGDEFKHQKHRPDYGGLCLGVSF